MPNMSDFGQGFCEKKESTAHPDIYVELGEPKDMYGEKLELSLFELRRELGVRLANVFRYMRFGESTSAGVQSEETLGLAQFLNRGLFSTLTSGRSEHKYIGIDRLEKICPALGQLLRSRYNIPDGYKIMIVIKGSGYKLMDIQKVLGIFLPKKSHSFVGFTATDSNDIHLSTSPTRRMNVLDIHGKGEIILNYTYTPARLNFGEIPINKICMTDDYFKLMQQTYPDLDIVRERDLRKLKERLVVTVIAEMGGENVEDINNALFHSRDLKVSSSGLVEYFKYIVSVDPSVAQLLSLDRTQPDILAMDTQAFLKLMLRKYWMDSQVESALFEDIDNRTLQNFCILGFRDMDIAKFRNVSEQGFIRIEQAKELFAIKLGHILSVLRYIEGVDISRLIVDVWDQLPSTEHEKYSKILNIYNKMENSDREN